MQPKKPRRRRVKVESYIEPAAKAFMAKLAERRHRSVAAEIRAMIDDAMYYDEERILENP